MVKRWRTWLFVLTFLAADALICWVVVGRPL